jgi:hypothetical protein
MLCRRSGQATKLPQTTASDDERPRCLGPLSNEPVNVQVRKLGIIDECVDGGHRQFAGALDAPWWPPPRWSWAPEAVET